MRRILEALGMMAGSVAVGLVVAEVLHARGN